MIVVLRQGLMAVLKNIVLPHKVFSKSVVIISTKMTEITLISVEKERVSIMDSGVADSMKTGSSEIVLTIIISMKIMSINVQMVNIFQESVAMEEDSTMGSMINAVTILILHPSKMNSQDPVANHRSLVVSHVVGRLNVHVHHSPVPVNAHAHHLVPLLALALALAHLPVHHPVHLHVLHLVLLSTLAPNVERVVRRRRAVRRRRRRRRRRAVRRRSQNTVVRIRRRRLERRRINPEKPVHHSIRLQSNVGKMRISTAHHYHPCLHFLCPKRIPKLNLLSLIRSKLESLRRRIRRIRRIRRLVV
jgi:hypothetical protein